jgi:hypothetical protein
MQKISHVRICAIALIRGSGLLGFVVCNQGCRVARAMRHMGNDNLGLRETVIGGQMLLPLPGYRRQ